ncbi:MAG: UDP-N-acetylglucosamine 2-epimerase (hydrolyzing) [Deltaproteobacteria bacterium]|nr:UDP-N-acetylglucosamine 2-epimerase (hydrolyzing) [Deltaproteobacteria bacterium]MCL4873366.1 UDP-N-acetylglucosamine 2-epimerase (hydrolyzing) [bacterium]
MRKIAVVTGTRAEYGLLYWIIKGIREDSSLELGLIATGMHLSPEFGLTVKEIEMDGFPIAERVEMLLSSDTEHSLAASMGIGVMGFAKTYERLRPDMVVLLGDRFEVLSAASAAVPFRIPIAHIHGGESTESLIDEQIRHAVTKLSHLHFTSTEAYRKRVVQMGEDPENVICSGAPGLESIRRHRLMERDELERALGLPKGRAIGVLTYHPVTLDHDPSGGLGEVLKAVSGFSSGLFWVITLSNADTGGRKISGELERFAERNPETARCFHSLGRVAYLSLLKAASVMLGNSSSGIIEAPSFGLPVVNVGNRQGGRIRAANVIDAAPESTEILKALKKALSPDFRKSLAGLQNPYGNGDASGKIIRAIKVARTEGLLRKRFRELSA